MKPMEVDVHTHLQCITPEQCDTAEMHREMCHYTCGVDKPSQLCFTALDLNGQAAPRQGASRHDVAAVRTERTGT